MFQRDTKCHPSFAVNAVKLTPHWPPLSDVDISSVGAPELQLFDVSFSDACLDQMYYLACRVREAYCRVNDCISGAPHLSVVDFESMAGVNTKGASTGERSIKLWEKQLSVSEVGRGSQWNCFPWEYSRERESMAQRGKSEMSSCLSVLRFTRLFFSF